MKASALVLLYLLSLYLLYPKMAAKMTRAMSTIPTNIPTALTEDPVFWEKDWSSFVMYGNPKASVIKIKKVQSKLQIPNSIELLLNDEDEVEQL